MFVVKRGPKVVPNTAQTFRTFWREGRDGMRATVADWQLHLNTLFPEVRLQEHHRDPGRGLAGEGRALRPARACGPVSSTTRERSRASTSSRRTSATTRSPLITCADVGASECAPLSAGKPMVEMARADPRDRRTAGSSVERASARTSKDERLHLDEIRRLLGQGLRRMADALLDGIERATDFRSEVMDRADLMDA